MLGSLIDLAQNRRAVRKGVQFHERPYDVYERPYELPGRPYELYNGRNGFLVTFRSRK